MERVIGVGGVFQKARDPKALAGWYHDHLGVPIENGQSYGIFASQSVGEHTVWATFPSDTDYFGQRGSNFMVNFRVQDLDAMMAQLRAAGVEVDAQIQEDENGRFGWGFDPEGNRFELWQPTVIDGG